MHCGNKLELTVTNSISALVPNELGK